MNTAKKDRTQKKLEEYLDVAADIINATLYNGKSIVKEDELELQPTSVLLRDIDGRLRERLRDLFLLNVRTGCRYAYIGIENQSGIDNTLPLRMVEIDAGAYRKQVDHFINQNKQSEDPAFTRQIHAEQKLVPVMTIILYYGENWDGPRTLLDMVDLDDRENLEPYLLNYELNIIELGKDPELYKKFHSDFRMIVQYLSIRKDRKKWKEFYEGPHPKIRHYREFLDAMAALTSDSRYRKLKEKIENEDNIREGDEVDMCWLMDMAEDHGIEKALLESVQNLTKNLKLTTEQAMAALGIPKERQKTLRKLL